MDDGERDRSLPICDAHHHLWELPGSTYLVADLRADLASTGRPVSSTVYVECTSRYRDRGPQHLRPVGETEWVVGHAEDVAQGIVGFADLSLGDAVEEVLAAHVEAGAGRFKGVRHITAWDPSPLIRPVEPHPPGELMRDPTFRRGFAAVHRAGLSFDAWLYFTQLPELVELARAFPDARIVLDHLGGPIAFGPYAGRRREVLEIWRSHMVEVARCPNVALKLGGIGMSLFGLGWHRQPERPTAETVADAWGDDIRWCIEQFGVERCLFQSNFPVDAMSIDYATLWDAFDLMTRDLGRAERSALFCDTAESVYRLSGP